MTAPRRPSRKEDACHSLHAEEQHAGTVEGCAECREFLNPRAEPVEPTPWVDDWHDDGPRDGRWDR